ncbi:MAG: CBS domain-containing protein [Betaproteobacteria bacterium]|nr:CBS domain-containing protein [Betaproteobacteria bacterium]
MRLPTEKLKGLHVRDYMASSVLTFTPDVPIADAVQTLVRYKYSGAPVVDDAGHLVGMLSEKDCLRVVVLDGTRAGEALVGDYMVAEVETVEPGTDLLDVAEGFMQASFKRFPVVEGGVLVGQISRIDVLRAIDELLREDERLRARAS